MKSTFLLLLVILLIFCQPSESWRTFWKGRRYGGNIGHPVDSKGLLRDADDNEDLWFTQNLNHFDPMNLQTWKQVKKIK